MYHVWKLNETGEFIYIFTRASFALKITVNLCRVVQVVLYKHVYLVSCLKCKLRYVGQTSRPIKKRIYEHKRGIKLNKKHTYLVEHVNSVLTRRINLAKTFIHINNSEQISTQSLQKSLSKLKQNFVITTANKASNNHVFICKKFYISELQKELGIVIQDK